MIVFGITGGSGSGKSEFAENIAMIVLMNWSIISVIAY